MEALGTTLGGTALAGRGLVAVLLAAGTVLTGAGLVDPSLPAGLTLGLPAGLPEMADFGAFPFPACGLGAATDFGLALPALEAGAFAFAVAFTCTGLAAACVLAPEAAMAGAGLFFTDLPGDFPKGFLGDNLDNDLGDLLAGRAGGFPIERTLFLSGLNTSG